MKDELSVIQQIQENIKNKTPFSLIRLGDGEGIFLYEKHKDHTNFWNYVSKRQWGYVINEEQKNIIRSLLIDSIDNSSLLGIPIANHKRNDSLGFWSYIETYLNERNIKHDFCSIDIHTDLLGRNLLDKLLSEYNGVLHYISGHNLVDGFRNKYPNLKEVIYHQIPSEQLYFPDLKDQHYPTIFNKLINEISANKNNNKGELWLVGGGILGKIYCNEIKKNGGIAIDLGHVFDNWAGYSTRGPQGKIENNTYKLEKFNINNNFVITSQMTEDYFEMSKPLFETIKKNWKGRFIIGCIDFEPKNYDGEYYLMKRSEIKSFRTDFPSNRINYVCPQAGEFIDLIPNINDNTVIIQIDSDTIMQRPFTDEELEKIWINDNEILAVYNSNPPVNLFEVCKNLSFKNLDKYRNLDKFYEFTASMIIANKKTFKILRDNYINSMDELASVCQHHAGGQWLINKIAYENFNVKIIDSTYQCGSWYMSFNTKVIDNYLYLNDKMVIFNHTKYLDNENILTFLNEHIKQ